MKKDHKLYNFKIKPARLITIGAVATGLLISLILYWAVLAPVVALYLLPHNHIHTDLSLYTRGEYREFEDADKFDIFVGSFHFPQSAQPISFYHVDNRREDNPIYGKRSDVFSVDMKLSESDYEMAKASLMQSDNYVCNKGDYALYITQVDLGRQNWGVIAFDDTNCVIRCIVVTYLQEVEGRTPAQGIKSVLENKTNLSFE